MRIIALNDNGAAYLIPTVEEAGRWVKNHRKSRGLSLSEVASVVGVTKQAVCGWETGKSRPSINALARLSEFFQIGQVGKGSDLDIPKGWV